MSRVLSTSPLQYWYQDHRGMRRLIRRMNSWLSFLSHELCFANAGFQYRPLVMLVAIAVSSEATPGKSRRYTGEPARLISPAKRGEQINADRSEGRVDQQCWAAFTGERHGNTHY